MKHFIAKLMGLDLNRSYTDEELEAFKDRWDNRFRQMIMSTYILCAGAIVDSYVYQVIVIALK